jgi:hypothetical protein
VLSYLKCPADASAPFPIKVVASMGWLMTKVFHVRLRIAEACCSAAVPVDTIQFVMQVIVNMHVVIEGIEMCLESDIKLRNA